MGREGGRWKWPRSGNDRRRGERRREAARHVTAPRAPGAESAGRGRARDRQVRPARVCPGRGEAAVRASALPRVPSGGPFSSRALSPAQRCPRLPTAPWRAAAAGRRAPAATSRPRRRRRRPRRRRAAASPPFRPRP